MILDQIESDLKAAQKEKNETKTSALRNLKAALKNAEIEKQESLSEEEVMKIVGKKVKQHKDSIESFQSGNRMDLVETEIAQMKVLQKYLPKQMDESAVEKAVLEVISELNASTSDFGKVMKEVMNRLKGQTEGSMVSGFVKKHLK